MNEGNSIINNGKKTAQFGSPVDVKPMILNNHNTNNGNYALKPNNKEQIMNHFKQASPQSNT